MKCKVKTERRLVNVLQSNKSRQEELKERARLLLQQARIDAAAKTQPRPSVASPTENRPAQPRAEVVTTITSLCLSPSINNNNNHLYLFIYPDIIYVHRPLKYNIDKIDYYGRALDSDIMFTCMYACTHIQHLLFTDIHQFQSGRYMFTMPGYVMIY